MEVSSSSTDTLLKSLISRGWCFSDDLNQVRAIITVQYALTGASGSSAIDAVEAELCNVDLRSIGGKSLPEPSLLRKPSYVIQPPKVLQVVSVRDICRSSMVGVGNSSRRLLKMILSDGQYEIPAVEYSPIPSLSDNVVPGTKVRLERKVGVRYGIVCLTPDVITVLGGLVQSLYEEWQMNQKYAGFSRSALRLGRESGAGGPPPFEKLQVGGPKHVPIQNVSRGGGPTVGKPAKDGEYQQTDRMQASNAKADVDSSKKATSSYQKAEEKATASDTRPKEVADYIPIQNQEAAQKLRQKLNNPNYNNERHKGHRHRGRGAEEEKPVFTLDEWERRKAGVNPVAREERPNLSHDEELAWRLQNQFDLEDQQQQWDPQTDKAQDLKKTMFSYERNDTSFYEGEGSRGRGRGRGSRGSRRGRGRGRGRRGRG